MATIKSHTDLPQSKKLAEFLPLESADNHYWCNGYNNYTCGLGNSIELKEKFEEKGLKYLPCWSLAALLGVLPFVDFTTPQLIGTPKTLYMCKYNDDLRSHPCDNPVDACYEMILKLNELNLL